ncbi:L-amino acid amidase [Grifola frondosa]|uniref:L-amino acid amidase n=1 Tax=Grifola frondosa TaxID=5627 RepID=A0A1C7M0K8_GRIFR|nr:L-amino acid amidase [Grifola frondosa]
MSSSFTPSSEGTVDFVVGRETYHTWYSVYGDLTDHNHWRTPLIVVHGGPGLTHDYLLPISDLAHTAHIPVVFYDQLGNGRSTHLRWRPPAFWSIDLFVDELANLVARLGVQDAFDVLGHSWGGRLAAEWEVRRQPAGLRRLVLSNTFASVALWERSLAQLRQRLPEKVQEELRWAHGVERHDAALEVFQAKHMCTVSPLPAEFRYSMEQTMDASGDPTVWNAM